MAILRGMPASPHVPRPAAHARVRGRRRAAVAAATSAAVLLSGCGAAIARGPHSAGADAAAAANPQPACAGTVRAALGAIALRTYDQAASGANVASSVRRLAESGALASAVARDDARATRAALAPLLRDQIHRIVVTRGAHVLADLGSGAALGPVRGTIHDAAGAPIGRYTLAVGEDAGIARLIRALTGAQVVMRVGGDDVATTLSAATGKLPTTGTVTVRGVRYAVSSVNGTAFPAGALRISLLYRGVDGALCGATPKITVANTVGAVGQRLLTDETRGAATARVLRVVAGNRQFVAAVARRDPRALRAQIVRFFRDPTLHVVRIRAVTARGGLIGDVGGPYVLAPASAPVRVGGRTVGRVTLSIQDDTGYIKLMRRFTGAEVILRTPAGRVPGSSVMAGSATLPTRGSVTVGARTYQVTSFAARAFPSGPLRISLLVPPALTPAA